MKDDFTADYFSLQSVLGQTAMVLQFVWTLSRFCGVCLAFSLAVKKEDNCAEIHADFL